MGGYWACAKPNRAALKSRATCLYMADAGLAMVAAYWSSMKAICNFTGERVKLRDILIAYMAEH